MKKARATKILCAVLTVMMVLGTGLSAMASVETTSFITYDVDAGTYTVTTDVTGLTSNEMVTYLVHNANSMYEVAPANIKYIDQKDATGTTARFSYTGEGDWNDANKIYVGAESLNAPVEEENLVELEGATVTVNGDRVNAAITGEGYGIKKIALDNAASVSDVKLNGTSVDFFVLADSIGFESRALVDTDVIAITTGNTAFTGELGVKLGTVKVDKNSFVAFARVKGAYDSCGIAIEEANGNYNEYNALAVSGVNGAFAIQLIDESAEADLASELSGAMVYVYAYDTNGAPCDTFENPYIVD